LKEGFDSDEFVAYLYSGFRHEDHNLTPEIMHDIIAIYDLNDLMIKLQESGIMATPDDEVKNVQMPNSIET